MRFLVGFFLLAPSVIGQTQLTPPVAPVRPVTDTYFGTTITDPYRWMETSTDELLAYMKAQNAVTEQALQPFSSKNAEILAELTKLSNAVASTGRGRILGIHHIDLRSRPDQSVDHRPCLSLCFQLPPLS